MADKFQPAISRAASAVLSRAVAYAAGPPRVVLTTSQLDRTTYEEVNEALMRLGGKWKGGKMAAHVFESDPTADLAAVVASGMMPPKNPLAFFPTPPALARDLIVESEEIWLRPAFWGAQRSGSVLTILEPSAGRGALIDAILECLEAETQETNQSLRIFAVEMDPRHAAYLRAKYAGGSVEVIEGDFLTWSAPEGVLLPFVVMNPPFTAEKDSLAFITHTRRAWELLAPGGQLLAITPSGWTTRQDRK